MKLFHFVHFLDSYSCVLETVIKPFTEGDTETVLKHFLPLIKREASKYNRLYRCDLDDLVSVGIIGLYDSIQEREQLKEVTEEAIIKFVKSRVKRAIFREFDKKKPLFLGYVEKQANDEFDLSELVEHLKLDPLEQAVLNLLVQGYTQREICRRGNYSPTKLNKIVDGLREKYHADLVASRQL